MFINLIQRFPNDERSLDIDHQFILGPSLMISSGFEQNKVYSYFPKTRWFDYYSGKEVVETGRVHEIDTSLGYKPLFVKGGSIISTKETSVYVNIE